MAFLRCHDVFKNKTKSYQDVLIETETFILKITFITIFWDIKCPENLDKHGRNRENQ